jgi:predicted dehydrogenase
MRGTSADRSPVMSDSNPIPVGVVGCGRMGRLHARVYSQMPGVKLVGVVDADPDAAEQTALDYGSEAFKSVEELAKVARAVTVAVPTVYHLDAARTLIPAGVACLIEKPLAQDSARAREIVDLAQRHNVPVMVGHIERFNPVVRAMHDLKIAPQFIEVVRISPLTFRSIDVGVVLDIMIHDIDIILNLAASEPVKVDAAGVSVLSGEPNGAEDVCNARVTFANGCVANFTASRLALKTERKLRVFSPEAYVSLDYGKKHGIFVRRTENLDALRETVRQIRAGEIDDITQVNYHELVDVQELKVETDSPEPLRVELESFIGSVRDGSPLEIPATDGLKAVELAERIVAAMPRRAL